MWLRRLRTRLAAETAGLVHELHRMRIPLTSRVVLPLDTKALEAQLADIHEAFASEGLEFWLRDGTALGLHRDGGIIPWDDDLDLGIWAEDVPKAEAIMAGPRLRGFALYKHSPDCLGYLRDLETVELVVSGFDPPPNEYERVLDSFFHDLGTLTFRGRSYRIPRRIETYLEFSYGPSWRTPDPLGAWASTVWLPEAERRAHVERFLHADRGSEAG
jgi:hypothetical protein